MNFFELLENRPFVSQVVLHYTLFMLLYLIIRTSYIILMGKWDRKNEISYFIGMLYINFVIALTMTPVDLTLDSVSILSRIQLHPFDTVTRYWPLDGEYSLYNILGNLILMIPMLPILTYCFKVSSIKKGFIFTLFFTASIEIGQLFFTTTRACDIDDVILNMGGFCISAVLWWFIQKIRVVK
ncbi:hypothetical protein AwErysi_08180 [Erysipelotrichaceae bacterium]|nr:hypothetical protein AwErysi_08180 [Erysipelotrichaceae bacterium]